MNAKKWYHDLNDVYVVFFVLLVVVVLVLTGADRCDNSKHKNSSIENLNQ